MSSDAAPSRFVRDFPVYFGWPVTAAATVAMAATLPGQTAGVSLFIDSFVADLGLSRATVSLAYTGATVGSALVLPSVGRALDRWGPRRGVVVVAALFSASCVAVGQARGLATLAGGFFLLRALGQGSLSLTASHAVNLWFVRRRGVAVGVMGLGMAAAVSVVPGLIERGIGGVGWRETYVWMGTAVAAVLLPVGAVFFRRRPEAFGLRPDGRAPPAGAAPEAAVSLADARRTVPFWSLTAGLAATSCIGTALLFHHVDVMASGGLSRADAARLFVPYGAVTAVSSLGAGALVDRFGPGRVLAGSLAVFAAMTAAVPSVATAAGVWLYGAAFGVTQSANGNVGGSGYAALFGRSSIGAIKGFTTTVFVAATAVGPPLVAWGAATVGYGPTLRALALVPAACAALAWATVRPPAGDGRPRGAGS